MAYKFNTTRKYQGLALVITNFTKDNGPLLERGGAKIDVKYMKKTFKRLGFKVVSYKNLCTSDFEKVLSETSTDPALEDFDCFVFAISTHGVELEEADKERGLTVRKHAVQMFDGKYYSTSKILEFFSCCEALTGKPKLFFIQACRIPETEASTEQRRSGIGFDRGTSPPKHSGGENKPGGDKTDHQGSDDISEKAKLVTKEEDVSDTDIEKDDDIQGEYRPPKVSDQACRIPETEASKEQRRSGTGHYQGISAHKPIEGKNEAGGDKTDYQGSDDISEKAKLVTKEADVSDTDLEEDEDKQGGYRPPPPLSSAQKQSKENTGSGVQANLLESGDVVDPPRVIRLSQEKNIITPVPCHNDMLVMFASPQGHYAIRHIDMGSYLLSNLYEAVKQFYGNGKLENNETNFLEILRQVTSQMASRTYFGHKEYTVVPCIVHKLTKDIIFTRGKTMAHTKFMKL
ncbi:uncharacterized protein LOC133186111 [Saccostrea echinata]|uniref:uncharacterized protein LOC133186111 n=1 Tax=Saccostrea echinata TaxID=191078 RepID=UPI002A80DC66|nr:uncharacterized protein LOC133186111 [Saccostrea echinata]